jgi:uncharacterized protein YegP (UPF0339 family)
MRGKVEIFKDKKGEWRFRVKAGNNKIIAVSEGYKTKQGCKNGVDSLQWVMSGLSLMINEVKENVS